MRKKEYEVTITITDCTRVDAYSEEEAIDIAEGIFEENGLIIGNYEFDVYEVGDIEDER